MPPFLCLSHQASLGLSSLWSVPQLAPSPPGPSVQPLRLWKLSVQGFSFYFCCGTAGSKEVVTIPLASQLCPSVVASGLQRAGEGLLSVPAAAVLGLSKPHPLPMARRAGDVMGWHVTVLSSPHHAPASSSWTSASLSGQRSPSQELHLGEHPMRQSTGWPGTQMMAGGPDTISLAKRHLRDQARSRDLSQEKLWGNISISPSRCHLSLLPPPGASPTQEQGRACQTLQSPRWWQPGGHWRPAETWHRTGAQNADAMAVTGCGRKLQKVRWDVSCQEQRAPLRLDASAAAPASPALPSLWGGLERASAGGDRKCSASRGGESGDPAMAAAPRQGKPGNAGAVVAVWAAAAGLCQKPTLGTKACPGDLPVHPGEPTVGQVCPPCCLPRRGCSCFPCRRDGGSSPAQIPSADPQKRNGADRYLSEAELREMIINVDGQAGE